MRGLRETPAIAFLFLTSFFAFSAAGCSLYSSTSHATGKPGITEPLPFARWVRIFGAGNEASAPILRLNTPGHLAFGLGDNALTLTADIVSSEYPYPMLVLVHCDHNWQPTQSIFVQDVIHLRSSEFSVERSAPTARSYDYSISTTFPQPGGTIQLKYSGNYIARILDYNNNSRVLAEARFFVIESKAALNMSVYGDFFQSAQTIAVQNGVKVRVESQTAPDLFANETDAMSLYKSGDWLHPMTAATDTIPSNFEKGETWIKWDPYLGSKAVAEFSNIPAGTEHRLLDLTDLALYPPSTGIVTTPLSDLPRDGNPSYYDNNGFALTRLVPDLYNDYVSFEFRLDLAGYQVKQDIFVVGTFNNWTPSPQWQLSFNKQTGSYIARGLIKRAVHEYEYVAGEWDEDRQVLRHAEATLLEGNSRFTDEPYYAFVYYHEASGGGYDRIIGAAVEGGG